MTAPAKTPPKSSGRFVGKWPAHCGACNGPVVWALDAARHLCAINPTPDTAGGHAARKATNGDIRVRTGRPGPGEHPVTVHSDTCEARKGTVNDPT